MWRFEIVGAGAPFYAGNTRVPEPYEIGTRAEFDRRSADCLAHTDRVLLMSRDSIARRCAALFLWQPETTLIVLMLNPRRPSCSVF